MILRRVTANFRKQDWTAVMVELVVVIAGVFIGLQASNWNAAQADARLGTDYVKRLTRDLAENIAGVGAEIAYYEDVLKSVEQTDMLLRPANPDPRTLIVSAYRATEIIYTPPATCDVGPDRFIWPSGSATGRRSRSRPVAVLCVRRRARRLPHG